MGGWRFTEDVEEYAAAAGPLLDADPAGHTECLGHGGLTLWEDERGVPLSLASGTRPAAGVVRIGPVYTPPALRRRGLGAAVTAAATEAALERGARAVVLFTDLANPTSNALYQRLGYRPVTDRALLGFEAGREEEARFADQPAGP